MKTWAIIKRAFLKAVALALLSGCASPFQLPELSPLSTLTPTPMPTETPTPVATSGPVETPTQIARELNARSYIDFITNNEIEIQNIPPSILEIWAGSQEILPDYRETMKVYPVNYILPFSGEERRGLGWRIGFTEIIVDQEFIEMERPFARHPEQSKPSNTMFLPRVVPRHIIPLEYLGALPHAVNLGIFNLEEYDPEWYNKFLGYLKAHPNLYYLLKGDVREGDMYKTKNIGTFNPNLPTRAIVLPPILENKEALETKYRILGGDERAPFRLPYMIESDGYFGIFAGPNGQLTIVQSGFLFNGKLPTSGLDGAPYYIASVFTLASFSELRTPHSTGYGLPKPFFMVIKNLYENQDYKDSLIIYSSPPQ